MWHYLFVRQWSFPQIEQVFTEFSEITEAWIGLSISSCFSPVSCWHCGSILVSYPRGCWVAGSSPSTVMTNIFSLTSVKPFRENSIVLSLESSQQKSFTLFLPIHDAFVLYNQLFWKLTVNDFQKQNSTNLTHHVQYLKNLKERSNIGPTTKWHSTAEHAVVIQFVMAQKKHVNRKFLWINTQHSNSAQKWFNCSIGFVLP